MAEDNTRYIPQERLLTQREGDYGELTPEDYETSWSDYRRALVSGGAGVVSGLAGGAEYLTGGALGGDTRRYFGEISDDQIKAMSPVGRRAIQAEFLPEEGEASVFDNFASSLGLKTVSALPSLVSSIVPAGLAVKALQGASLGTRALAGAVTTRGTAGLMAGGDVAGQIYSAVEKIEDKDLQEKSDVYAGYRSMMSEADARRLYNQDVAKAAPAIAALISSALGGAESQAISRYAGKTAAAGFFRGVGRGAGAEATQEAAESGVGELLAQLALTDQNLAQMNWQKILSKGLEGATIGGIMGGGVGGISGIGGRPDAGTLTATSDPEAIKKLMEAEQAPETESQGVVPPKGYGTGTAPAPAEDPTAGNPQSAPSGSETQYPKGKSPSFTIDTVRSRLEAKGIEFPENRLPEINDRLAKIRRMKKGEKGSQFAALLDDLYAIGGAEGEVAPGVSISAGPDAAQVVAMNAATPVQKVQAPPSVMAPVTPTPVSTAFARQAAPKAPVAPAPQAPVDTGTNIQEPSADLTAQQQELLSGQRAVQMFPTNTTPLELPKGMKEVTTSRGVFHYNPKAKIKNREGKLISVNKGLIERLSVMGRENELLGLGDRSKQEVAAAAPSEGGVTTVSETTPEGARVRSTATTVADAERQAQVMRETAAPQNNVVVEPTEQALAPRVTPPGPRVLRDVSEAGQAADAAQAEADAAAAARVAEEKKAILEKAKADEKAEAVKGKVGREASLRKISKTALEVMKEVEAVAAESFKAFSPTTKENMFFVGADESKLSDQDIAVAKSAMVARLKAMVKEYDDGIRGLKETYKGVKAAEGILKAARRGSKQSDEIVFILRARHFVADRESTKSGGAFKTFADFAAKELQYRGGRESAAEERTLETEELARKAKIPGLAADKVEEGPVTSQVEALVDTGLSPEERMIAAEENADAENFNRSKEEVEEVFAQGRDRPSAIKSKAEEVLAKVRERKKKAEELAERGATEGERQAASAAVERIAKSEETVAEKAQEIAVSQFVTAGQDKTGKFKVGRGNKDLRPTVVGKVSLKPKAAAAVSAAKKADVIESSNVPMDAGWADAYAGLDPNRNIIYSDDTIALMSARATNGKTLYVPIHRTGGIAKVDIDNFAGKIFTKEQTDRLKAAKKADVELRETNRPDNAIRFPNGEYIVPDRTIRLADALNGLDLSGLSDTFSIIRDRVIRDVKDVPVHIVSPAEIAKAAGRSTDLGFYSYSDATGEHILIRNDLSTDATIHTVVHEAVHSLVIRSMKNNVQLNNLAVAVANEVRAYWTAKGADISGMPFARYAYTHVDEFMAEAWGNKEFQNLLAKTPISPTLAARLGIADWRKSTMWDAVIKFVQRALKLPNDAVSALEAVIRVTDEAATARATLPTATGQGAPLQSANIAGDTLNAAGDMQRWLVGKAKRGAAMFANNRNLAQQYANTVIGPGLQQIVDAVSATLPRAQEVKEAGDRLASRSIKLAAEDPEEFRKLTEIMQSARMMSISIEGENFFVKNPNTDATKYWQAKARFKDLQAQFASLKNEEMKQLYRDMAAFYRNTHNDLVQSKVTSILENLGLRQARGKAKGTALTDAQIADLTQRVMNQEMTPADKELLGTAMYNSLKNAADFHRVEGDYFPLMRYGDYVVTTSDKIKDTMGGKLEEPDTVLFRDKSNTVARRAAENFVKKSEILHLSTEKVYFDNATNTELANEDEAKSYNDVDIGYRVKMQTKGVYFFESGMEAETFARTNPEGHDTISNPEIRMGSGYQAQVMTGTQVASMNSAIDARVKSGNITEGQGALLKSIVNEAATRMLTGNRIASRRLKAKKVTGASTDVARNLLQYNASAAREIATSENMPLIRDGLDKISKAITGYAGSDRAQLVAVVDEIKARVDQGIVAPNEPSKYMKDLMSIVFLARLFSPAYTVINGMQPWMVTAPVLGGKFGGLRAATALGRAYTDIGFGNAALQGMMNTARAAKGMNSPALLDTRDIFGDMRAKILKTSDGDAVVRMLDELARLGAIDKNAGLEVSATTTEGRGRLPKIIAGVDRIARQLPQMMEAVNRTVSATAAYRLARQDGQTHEEATRFALNTVTNTQGDYSAANAPRFFNNPILRPALMFKKYAQMMTYLLGDMAYRAFKGATPEERKVALSQLGYILGVQIAVAGALSLPGLEIIKAGFLLASFLGIGGGWDEVEEKLRKALDETVGKPFGQMISSGILTRLGGYGIDVSQRMSLADMWLFGEPKSDTSEGMQAYLFRQVAGAPGGYVLDVVEGFRLMVHEGEVAKGLGRILPAKFAADTAKALHGKSESAYEKDAEKKTVSGYGEIAANIFGFKTARQAEVSRRTGANIRERKDKEKEFKQLLKEFRNARTKGDQIKAIARNREWNDSLSKSEWRLRLPVKPRELRTAQ